LAYLPWSAVPLVWMDRPTTPGQPATMVARAASACVTRFVRYVLGRCLFSNIDMYMLYHKCLFSFLSVRNRTLELARLLWDNFSHFLRFRPL
jgi:hypothetical protein